MCKTLIRIKDQVQFNMSINGDSNLIRRKNHTVCYRGQPG